MRVRDVCLVVLVGLVAGLPACDRGRKKAKRDAPASTATGGAKISPEHINQIDADGKFLPARAPPAPRPPPSRPALPDLPALSNQPRGPRPPARLDKHKCGSVVVVDRVVPLDCIDREYGVIEHASSPLIGYDVLHGTDVVLPAVVDHRADGTEGPVRDQGEAPICTAFSLAAAVDHALNRWTGVSGNVSAMQIWARYHIPKMSQAAPLNLEQPLAPDGEWPYNQRTAVSWIDAATCAKLRREGEVHSDCGGHVDLTRLKAVDQKAVAEISDIAQIRDSRDIRAIKTKLALGQDVWVGLHAGSHLSCGARHCGLTGAPGARYVRDYDATSEGGHALVIAGYATFPHGTYFLLHNSWGERWGDGGYAWMHEETLKRNVERAYVVDAHPVDRSKAARARRAKGHTTCGPGLVPDSISAQCVPPCPDGSPRHNAICPVAKHCPAGEVNLTGVCVAAAPAKSGVDPRTKITWKCGPGGCVYTVPKGVGSCDLPACTTSCPAPDFRLGNGRHGLMCME